MMILVCLIIILEICQNVLILSIVDREDMEDQLIDLRNLSKKPTQGLRSIADLPKEKLERLKLDSLMKKEHNTKFGPMEKEKLRVIMVRSWLSSRQKVFDPKTPKIRKICLYEKEFWNLWDSFESCWFFLSIKPPLFSSDFNQLTRMHENNIFTIFWIICMSCTKLVLL